MLVEQRALPAGVGTGHPSHKSLQRGLQLLLAETQRHPRFYSIGSGLMNGQEVFMGYLDYISGCAVLLGNGLFPSLAPGQECRPFF